MADQEDLKQLPMEEEESEGDENAMTSSPPPNMDRGRTTSTSSQGSAEGGVGRTRSFSTSSGGGRTIVMAVDPSDFAKYAFEWFLENIHRSDDMVVLVHCPEAPRLPTFSFKSPMAPPVDEWKKILDDMNSKTRKLEEDYETTCIQRKLKYKVKGDSNQGKPGEGIVKTAITEGASLVVMGTRGIGQMRRALLGSVSDYVARHSPVPILIVPNKARGRADSLRTTSLSQ